MIVVKIELWPKGDESRMRMLGLANIANDGTGSEERGNYVVELLHSGKYWGKPGTWKSGRVVGHRRRALSPYHLVVSAIRAALGHITPREESGRLFGEHHADN